MDLRESMRGSVKVFRKGLCVQLAVKLFCLKILMVYGGYLRSKNPTPAVTQTPGNMQSRHAPQEPHTYSGMKLFSAFYHT